MEFDESFDARWARLQELGPIDVHDVLKLRQDVFLLEQTSLYQDIDGKDPDALHLLVRTKTAGDLVGIIRLFAEPDVGTARIGRVVIASGQRGSGLGRKMMLAGIEKAGEIAPGCPIDLSAQAHLEEFYNALGFETVSDKYIKDGILHIDMICQGKRPG
ncbi:ElaA protein [Labrenzia sp. EL_126]|nr:ElaA protein [Labrenzia sp. EL_126]